MTGILDAFDLSGKVALVTGANRGLGRAMAMGLAEAGADIAGLNRADEPVEVRAEIEHLGRRYHHIQCDLQKATVARLTRVVRQVVTAMGRLDILVNNAGTIRRAPAIEVREADWDPVLHVNLKAMFFLSQAAAGEMVKGGKGKIIQVSSVIGYQGGLHIPSYAAAKHGVIGITQALANEWAPLGINVNGIAPGYFRTDITSALQQDRERNRAIMARIPAGRWGDPADLKGVVVFLASDASDFMHGATVTVDGGWLAR
jgi:2-deoxy-D-gluconate 3-dehydrogenase